MSDRTFTYGFNPNVYDHGAAQERERIEQLRQERERDQRVTDWLVKHFAGHQFATVDELTNAAVTLTESIQGGEMPADDPRREVLRLAAIGLVHGFVDPRRYAGKILVTRGAGVRFLAPQQAA